MSYRNRIKELRLIPAEELIEDPRNWRRHPPAQNEILNAVLQELGIIDALLARETPEGIVLIDGHGRRRLNEQTIWPVLILDVDETEAAGIMTVLDPITAMADGDADTYRWLQEQAELKSEIGRQLIETTAVSMGIYPPGEGVPAKEQVELAEVWKIQVRVDPDVFILFYEQVNATRAKDVDEAMNIILGQAEKRYSEDIHQH